VTLWREGWMMHGIGLLWLRETDSANFPSNFTWPIVIFLLDYRKNSCGLSFVVFEQPA
jgi:hypothetical protein